MSDDENIINPITRKSKNKLWYIISTIIKSLIVLLIIGFIMLWISAEGAEVYIKDASNRNYTGGWLYHEYLNPVYGFIGIICGAIFAYPIAIKKARSWSEAMFRHISHEALIGAFMGLIFMLAFHEAGLFGILVTLIIGIFGGFLNNYFGIHTGVQFMAYYASGWIVTNLMVLCGILA